MTRNRKILAGVSMSFAFLVACDGSDGIMGNPASQFGPAFAAAFNAGPNDVPSEDLLITYLGNDEVSLTDAPVDF